MPRRNVPVEDSIELAPRLRVFNVLLQLVDVDQASDAFHEFRLGLLRLIERLVAAGSLLAFVFDNPPDIVYGRQ